MSDLARRFMEALQRDESFDLTGFHPDEFATVSTQLVDTPACAAFFQALLDAGTPSSTSAAVSLVAAAGDPGVLAEVVCQLAGASQMTEDLVRRLHRAFLDTSGSRELYSGTRAQALLGALSLSTGRPSLMRQLQSHLLDVEVSDDGEYLRHVAKIDGLLLTHVQDNDLKVLLERLLNVPEAEDEASFALGLLAIAEALDASERALALKAFSSARNFMQRAMDASEKRQDARLYVSCLDVLIEFHEGTRDDRLKDQLAEIRQSAYEYSAFLLPSERPIDRSTWLGASLVEGLRWAELGERLAMLEIDLIKSAWLNAARVIEEELLRVFEASRSILKRDAVGGIEAVVRPRIVGAIQANRVQLAMLDQWVEENREGLSAPTALAIRADIDAAMEASLCRNPANAAAAPANAAAILANAGLPTELNACAQNLITTAVAEIEMARVEPIVLGVLETVHNELLKNPDYCDTGQRFFISILYYTIIFLASRENMSVGSVPGIEYLFNRDRNSPP
ncbi:TPA: hypothetical protein L4G11_001227 [Pseudomonas aeruginosa]|nr:hypothetical protein [Pseudomonas aeruginosa]